MSVKVPSQRAMLVQIYWAAVCAWPLLINDDGKVLPARLGGGERCLFDSIGLKETDVGLSGTGAGAVDGEADQ